MRKPIQITTDPLVGSGIITTVLCDDGTIWRSSRGLPWRQLEGIPQPVPTPRQPSNNLIWSEEMG